MKRLNVKRLAAIGVGAALVGSAVAPLAYAGVMSNVDKLTKGDIVNASGNPVVSVVAGNNADVSDWIWAGNIAAKVAQLATVEKQVTVSGAAADQNVSAGADPNATVDFTVGGTVTVKGGKTFFDNLSSTTQEVNFSSQTVTNGSIPSLIYQGNKSYTVNGTTRTVTMQEQLIYTVNTEFDETITNKALVGTIATGGIQYVVDLGSGIAATENPSVSGSAKFQDDANDDVRIPFFGKEYLVNEVDKDSSPKKVVLIEAGQDKQYKEGDKVTGLLGRDGKDYSMVVGIGSTIDGTVNILLTLFDNAGKEVVQQNFPKGDLTFYGPNGRPVLQTLINIKNIASISTEGGGTIYRPTILVGTSRIDIRDGEGYPFDSTKTAEQFQWTAALTFTSDNNYLTKITIKNSSQNQFTGSKTLKTGSSADLPGGYGKIRLLGLQLPEFTGVSKTERVTNLVVGDEKLKYRDNTNETDHTIPFYINMLSVGDLSKNSTISFDTKTIYVDVSLANKTDLNIGDSALTGTVQAFNGLTIRDVNKSLSTTTVYYTDLNGLDFQDANRGGMVNMGGTADGSTIRLGGQIFRITDQNADVNAQNVWIRLSYDGNISFKTSSSGAPFVNWRYMDINASARRDSNSTLSSVMSGISLQGASDVNANYVVLVDEKDSNVADIWLLLAYQEFTAQYGKRLLFQGTDTGEIGSVDANSPFYNPNTSLMPADFNGGSSYNVNNNKIATFTLEEDQEVSNKNGAGITDLNFFVDTTYSVGNLIALPNSQLSTYSRQLLYDINKLGTVTFSVDEGQTQYPKDAYADWGTRMTIKSGVLTLAVPENRPQFEIAVEGSAVTREATGGEKFSGVKAGETKTTTGGTKVTVDKVSSTAAATPGGVGTPNPKTYKQVVPVGRLVYTASLPPAGSKIIVGGYLVNALAANLKLAKGTLKEALTTRGDRVAELLANGDIVVAGYTADDTVQAARDLISQLDKLLS